MKKQLPVKLPTKSVAQPPIVSIDHSKCSRLFRDAVVKSGLTYAALAMAMDCNRETVRLLAMGAGKWNAERWTAAVAALNAKK